MLEEERACMKKEMSMRSLEALKTMETSKANDVCRPPATPVTDPDIQPALLACSTCPGTPLFSVTTQQLGHAKSPRQRLPAASCVLSCWYMFLSLSHYVFIKHFIYIKKGKFYIKKGKEKKRKDNLPSSDERTYLLSCRVITPGAVF